MNHIINPQIWEIFQWSSMTWQSTPFFFLFVTFLIYVYFFIFQKKKSEGTLFIPFQAKTIQGFATWRSKLGKLPVLLKFLALAFIILALARPQISNTKSNKNVEGIDIVIVLDVSDSMLIEDMRPENRLESAKLTIKKFIEK
ncbi:MAG: hypothetical protein ACK5P5_01975, partial [Pseudobdellovibrionaceae bacterium]